MAGKCGIVISLTKSREAAILLYRFDFCDFLDSPAHNAVQSYRHRGSLKKLFLKSRG